ncbi:MAG: glycosyltransferase family 2 protein [Acidimicrobiales bacterium]|jgi:glycosyltransferase involved in cell wall biosynthesis|nr:glycosyltransferase family 2 protein [Acidimicrobiales bacterium]
MTPRTLVIIPALNEEDALPGVLADLAAVCPDLDVLVVDDGSRDRTAEVARAAGVLVAPLPYNLGIGGALRTGFRYALRAGYERAVQFDADGQHDPSEIAKLLALLDDGADMAIGSRFAGETNDYRVGLVRRRAMRLLHFTVRMLSGRNFSDTSSGFRAFNRDTLVLFATTYPVDYMDSVEALLLAVYGGLRVAEVPIQMRDRVAGVASNRNFKLIYHYLRLFVVLISSASRRGRHTPEAS